MQFQRFFVRFIKFDALLFEGIEEFNKGSFFEGPLFYQGLIRAARGFYHLEDTNHRGACSQFTKALLKRKKYVAAYHDV